MRYKTNTWAKLAGCAAMLCSYATLQAQDVFLLVDRTSGAVDVVSNGNLEVDGYELTSPAGRFAPDGWNSLADQGVAGWEEANPNSSGISELNWAGSTALEGGSPVSLGAPYSGGATLPRDEDVAFRYSMPGNNVGEGIVHYTGLTPVPTITVDRSSGAVSLSNPGSFPITAYSISSSDGSLNADAFNSLSAQGVDDFTEANPLGDLISELSLNSEVGFGADTSFDLGNIYGGGDLSLNYATADGSIGEGVVNFAGAIPDLVLQVDIFSGEATIQNMSANAGPFDVIGYAITSPSGTLSLDSWNSLSDQGDDNWVESNPRGDSIAELNTASSLLFENGVAVSLGNIFGGTQDLQFEYGTLEGTALGTVEYVLNVGDTAPTCGDIAASRAIAGDLNGDTAVNFADFLVLSNNFGQNVDSYEDGDIDCNGNVAFADFLVLSNNFGQTAGAAASVPEPATNILVMFAVSLVLPLRKRKRFE